MIAVTIVVFVAVGTTAGDAQTPVASLQELYRQLAIGDVITIVPTDGQPVSGRLLRLGAADLEIRPADTRGSRERSLRALTVPLDAIQSLERPRDPAGNGAVLGAGIGAGVAGALFLGALVVDRNELDEWAGLYAGAAAACTAIGALIGWAVDTAISKPHLRFDRHPRGGMTVYVQPVYSPGGRLGLVVSLSPTGLYQRKVKYHPWH